LAGLGGLLAEDVILMWRFSPSNMDFLALGLEAFAADELLKTIFVQ